MFVHKCEEMSTRLTENHMSLFPMDKAYQMKIEV